MPANRIVPLVDREALGGAYYLLSFRHPETAREARPGQFVMIKAGVSAEPPLRRPFSILSVDTDREAFTLFVKAVGPGSRGLAAMAPGDEALCLGLRQQQVVGYPGLRRQQRDHFQIGESLRLPEADCAERSVDRRHGFFLLFWLRCCAT